MAIRFAMLVLAFFAAGQISAATDTGFISQIKLSGNFYQRQPRSVVFERCLSENMLVSGSLLTVRSSVQMPLATDSAILVGSHTVTFYPGAMVRLLDNGIYPLSGRLVIVSAESSKPLNIFAGKFAGAITDGTLQIEVTPDNGVFVTLKNKGSAWFKDLQRKIFELNHGQQLHFPLFGETVSQSNPAGFWSDPPSGFASVRQNYSVTTKQQTDEDPAVNEDNIADKADKADKTDKTDKTEKTDETDKENIAAGSAAESLASNSTTVVEDLPPQLPEAATSEN